MRPPAAPRRPAAALGLCSLLLLLGPGHACPAGCACTDPHTVDCRDRGLPSVPDPFPLDVRKLLVAGNRIQQIPEDFFIFYGDLVYLDFRNNSLRSLEEGTFSGSAKLAFLDLSYNNLTQLGAGAFRSAGRLVKLSLANNNLAGVHEAAFETLESLQVLELNDNNLRRLNVAVLDALPALRTLRLDGNPWLCDCDFAHLFSWIQENASKLPKDVKKPNKNVRACWIPCSPGDPSRADLYVHTHLDVHTKNTGCPEFRGFGKVRGGTLGQR
uniref:leucine-rich repeat-containing protein 38 isoform X1 n=1 Tax=Urocitellus parryii TaxID=9999 RepID=UPI000E55AA9E|nr:leucine-rich repeat-containing protein 38 isoform X1 [Urocitellus parryii]